MNRKDEFIEKVQFELCGGDLTSDLMDRYHPSIIAPIIGEVLDGLLRSAYRQSSSQKGRPDSMMLDAFSKRFVPVPVLCDKVSEEYYAVLPVRVVDLDNNDGIRVISDTKDQANQYMPIPNNSEMYYAEEHDGPTAFNFYKLEGMKVYFKFKGQPREEVFMRLVPVFDDLEDHDIIGSPEIVSRNGIIGISDEVKRRMLMMPQTKTTEDNTTKNI